MRKIIISLSVVAAVAAAVVVGTTAFFSDTETSTGNTFTAGTIDISVENMNPWNQSFALVDMKPSYVDYINFEIQNTGSAPNPVDVWKKLRVTSELTGAQSEPECTEEVGTWNNADKTCTGMTMLPEIRDNLSAAIWYDLYVEVLDASNNKIWWQTIYGDGGPQTIDTVYGVNGEKEVYLGMIPANGKMKVRQSYHLATETTNWAQGDQMTFGIELRAMQIQGTAVLENKTVGPDYELILGDGFQGTLTYKVKNPTFEYTFTGKAPTANASYTLLAAKDPWPQTGSIALGTTTSTADGTVNFSGNPEINADLKNHKVWLILSSDWDGAKMIGWNQASYLLETGLIWYDDTNN